MQPEHQAFFFDAIRRGDLHDVSRAAELVPELIQSQDAKGYTPLIIAAYNNQPDVVALLLKLGADIDAADSAGNTALMGASFRGYQAVVQQLLDAGADVNRLNKQDAPALTFAATFGQLAIAELLLQRGARTDLRDSRGKSPLDHAVLQENEAMIALMKKHVQ